ncbi:hypothetical protein [Algoriphagus limi]|uniref:Uncharacterized protein n=1 Tax=Algoriphagus limi TaxID=2975273 RepID=A0ABT2G4G2_9BACT|nr:hypothetical protein [Algoriphagus limi]MCS5490171.1 hypothetical protein [Algoriphagus limi]
MELDVAKLKKHYRSQEVTLLILMLVALPMFGLVYLYYNSGNLHWNLPEIPDFFKGLINGLGFGLLIGQYLIFRQDLKKSRSMESFEGKVINYLDSSKKRFFFLFAISLLSTIGLLFFKSAWFVILFALALVFFSLARVSPDRAKRLLKLNKEETEILRAISRPD